MFLETCLDYGNSFIINNHLSSNAPRFEIKSCCYIKNMSNGRNDIFYQGPTMKSEITFGKKNLFMKKDNYDFTPVFGENQILLFRCGSKKVKNKYVKKKDVNPWGKRKIYKKEKKTNILSSFEEIFNSIMSGKRIIAQIEFEKNNVRIILEFPVETINCCDNKKVWQVDTGPVFFPDKIETEVNFKPYLTHVAFNNYNNNVNFIIEGDKERKDETILIRSNIKLMSYND